MEVPPGIISKFLPSLTLFGLAKMAPPLRDFAKYLKNGFYRSSFKVKSLRIGHSLLSW